MSIIEANITIDNNDDVNVSSIVAELQTLLASLNSNNTDVNVINMDDPISTNPLNHRQ